MNENLLYDKIEAYLLNRMSDAERAAFEAEIAADPALTAQFVRQKQEHEMMELLLEDKLAGKLKRWRQEGSPPDDETAQPEKGKFFTRRFFWIAGSITILAIALAVLLYNTKGNEQPAPPPELHKENEQPVVEKKYQKPEDQLQPVNPAGKNTARRYLALAESFREDIDFAEAMRGNADNMRQFNSALNDLENKRYQEGINYLGSVPTSDPNFWDAQYYLGLAYFEWGKFPQSIPVLTKVAEQKTFLFSEKASWFLALAYLQEGQITACKKQLDQIISDDKHPYYQKAKDLKTGLDKMG